MKKLLLVIGLLISCQVFGQVAISDLLTRSVNRTNKKDYAGAISDCKLVLQADSNNANALYLSGFCCFQTAQYKAAVTYFTRCIKSAPNFLEAYYYRGIARQELGEYWAAAKDLNRAREIEPYNSNLYIVKGFINSIFSSSK